VAREEGQATVELLGVVPALLALGLVVWQLTLVGRAAWVAAHAARAAARADLVGEDPGAAARSALPKAFESALDVQVEGTGATRVEVPVPIVHGRWGSPIQIAARAALDPVP
jgi:pilus assembly protein CpaE